ncbi:hypothetical protein IE077_003883 [Cardiosporidium cionae]|uniref:Hyaluronan/mRNA-binding protein domain-containing protein n=1 Tax=Cardiosporidium cionae TaxID=476202 RepID=A0ABQ7J7C9_9APIC|nr:hypothetical protein IE077_003883 [Cardiosporidium cionae]|eukprot:KAF8819854.1 hypothetical protein IE077_003883 [Cardiosporidium cionae]
MTPLKFSVGTTNKFYGLSIDHESSDEDCEENGSNQTQKVVQDLPDRIVSERVVNASANLDASKDNHKNDHSDEKNDGTITNFQKPRSITSNGKYEPVQTASSSGCDNIGEELKSSRESARRGRNSRGGRSREYSRLSGTGRGREMKKDGAGRHNWGSSDKYPENHIENDLMATHGNSDVSIQRKSHLDFSQEKTKLESPVVSENLVESNMIDLVAWKMQQAAKRVNAPAPVSKSAENNIDLIKEFESEGFIRYVKEQNISDGIQKDSIYAAAVSEEKENRKKKTVNAYEYLYKEQGHVALFPNHRGRGRRGLRGNRSDRFGESKQFEYPGRDAPDLKDSRAFPSLNETKIVI